MPRLTDKLAREIASPSGGRQTIIRDSSITGFAVRKTATGFTAFVFNYVANGRERRMTIGQFPAWSVAAARESAARLRRMVDAGEDPLELAQQARAVLTLDQLWLRYDQSVLPQKAIATQRDERSFWRRLILPRLGRRRLPDIKPADIDHFHREVSRSTPVQANRCIASLRHVFNKAIRWQLATANPVQGAAKNREQPRQRYLSDAEMQRFVAALDAHAETSSTLALKFLLLTGARRGEVLGALWSQIDLTNQTWTKPSSHTKQRRVHRVPLSEGAIVVLQKARDRTEGDFIFPGRSGQALVEIKKVFRVICQQAGIADFRIHDLRHSYASLLASSGVSLPMIGALLGHTQVATTARYSHLHDDALRAATDIASRKALG